MAVCVRGCASAGVFAACKIILHRWSRSFLVKTVCTAETTNEATEPVFLSSCTDRVVNELEAGTSALHSVHMRVSKYCARLRRLRRQQTKVGYRYR